MANIISDTSVAIISPLQKIWLKIVEIVPDIIGAIIVLIVGCFIGVILGHAVRVVLEKMKVDDYVRKARLTRAVGHTHVPGLVGEIVKWYIIILFLAPAVQLVRLGALSTMLVKFSLWLPSLMGALIIFLLGLAGIHYLNATIDEHTKKKGAKLANKILSWVLTVVLVILALKQIGINVSILENTFLIIVGAFALGLALALGIGLGLGLKKESEDIVRNIRKHF